jgi:hypothetical protein
MTIISCKIILCKIKYFLLILPLSVNKMHLLLRIHNIQRLNIEIDERNRFFEIGFCLVIRAVYLVRLH